MKHYRSSVFQLLRGYYLAYARASDGLTEVRVTVEVEHRGSYDRHVNATLIGMQDCRIASTNHQVSHLGLRSFPDAPLNTHDDILDVEPTAQPDNSLICEVDDQSDAECEFSSARSSYASDLDRL